MTPSKRKWIYSVINWFNFLMDYVTFSTYDMTCQCGKDILDVFYKCMMFTNY